MIELRDISKAYADKQVLDHVSLALQPGVTCLMGISGRGKTTLLRILMGLETPDAGEVRGRPARMAVQFQEDRLVDSLTVGANLKLALGVAYDARRAEDCLRALGLPECLRVTAATLSGGMKRRVSLARALLFDAPLLILDEPFQGLDDETRLLAIAAVKGAAQGRTALVVTHDAQDCALLGGRIVHL